MSGESGGNLPPDQQHSCKDCGVVFDSGKSLDVHLHYHKENLLTKWAQQSNNATTSGEDNNNIKKNQQNHQQVRQVQAAIADSSENYQFYQENFQQENGSAFHRINNRFNNRYHPYQQTHQQSTTPPVVSSSSGCHTSQQCDKCGFITDNILEHMQYFHPHQFIKEEAQILDLDSQKVHVYPNGEPPPPPQMNQWDSYNDEKDDKKPFNFDDTNSPSPDFSNVSTTSSLSSPPQHQSTDLMHYYNTEMPTKIMPQTSMKSSPGASWKSNEARRPKTYNCTACNKWFTSSGHLKRHYNTTLHKNAVKQSGIIDPANQPLTHHHPQHSKDNLEEKTDPPPQPQQPQMQNFISTPQIHHHPSPSSHHLIQENSDYHHQLLDFHHQFQPPPPPHHLYPNAMPPHVLSFGNEIEIQPKQTYTIIYTGYGNIHNIDQLGDFVIEENVGGHMPQQDNQTTSDNDIDPFGPESDEIMTSIKQDINYDEMIEEDYEDEEQVTSTSVQIQPPPLVKSKSTSNKTNAVFQCIDCDKTFNRACYLTQHNKSFHVGYKPFKCEKCGKRFETSEARRTHSAKHAGEKPHKCEICPKQFNHKTDLRRHMCLHTGLKPFHCDVCSKGFIRKDHMLKHVETHSKSRSSKSTRSISKQQLQLSNSVDQERDSLIPLPPNQLISLISQ